MTTLSTHASSRTVAGQRALLLVLAGNMLIDALEVSVMLVALPAMERDLGLSTLGGQWAMSGFAAGFAALLLLGPRLVARWGRRRVYLAALPVFIAASLVGGLAHEGALLIVTRVVKGMCAALTAPTGLAIISTTFRPGAEQRRAVSVYSLFGAAGFTAGLLSSGALTELSWRWNPVFPAPVALLLLVTGARLIPRDTAPPPAPALRTTLAGLLRDAAFRRSAVCAATLNGTYLGLLMMLTHRLADQWGWSSWRTALAFLPACVPLALALPFAGRMVARFGTERLIRAGSCAATLGCATALLTGAPTTYAAGVLPALLLVEAGFVLSFAALNLQATAGIAAERRAAAVPVYQTAVQLGAVLALPVTAAALGGGHRGALAFLTALSATGALVACTARTGGRGAAP
ncbi:MULTISPECIES: MFS transporter [unclassified Streptomyces]|uniref:MFS transporter n=1 Tax=unclassified Streptomyces TaxID=2593676 RepID=UPI000DB92962|nr:MULTISPECIES: MFS transporter [unclassified Streptomyces]MYT74275.1 MFS transporter [Streptomyces sp. SID8367]RAJ91251.1 putative MFS family arabinose efflux permease [Streptomyces sp. PsTaAH-137]